MRRLKAVIPVLACLLLASLAGRNLLAQGRAGDVERAFEAATQLHQSGDLEGAIRGYQSILAAYPQRVDVRSNLGAAYARLGRYEEAIAQYRQALARDSRNQTIRYNLALAYFKAAWYTEAAAEFAPIVAATPKDQPEFLSAVLLLADCRVRLGEYKQVIELLTPLEPAYGNNRPFAYLLGSALIGDQQAAKGQLLIDRVFREEDSAEARLLIGSILLLADDKPGAINEFGRALALNPKLPGLRAWFGRAQMKLGDSEKAIEYFKSELADNPNDFDANLYLGILLKRDRLLDESLNCLARATRLRPRDAYARYHLGGLYLMQGKQREARALLEAVTKEYPDFVEGRVLLASVYYRLNLKAEGDRERQIIQKLNAEQQSKQPGIQDGIIMPAVPGKEKTPR